MFKQNCLYVTKTSVCIRQINACIFRVVTGSELFEKKILTTASLGQVRDRNKVPAKPIVQS